MSFKRLEPEDFLVSNQSVSQTVWSGNQPSLFDFKILDQQKYSPSGKFYLSVYSNINKSNGGDSSPEEVQFDISYANKNGGNSTPYNNNYIDRSPSSTIYGQYRTLLMEDENSAFIFNGVVGDEDNDFFVLNISRSRFKEKLLPGSFNLTLTQSEPVDGYHDPVSINKTNTLRLTDNSNEVNIPEYYGTQRVYQIIVGENGQSANNITGDSFPIGDRNISYGWFLPDIGTILISAQAIRNLDDAIFPPINETGNILENFYKRIFRPTPNLSTELKGFTLNSEETISSDYVFVHIRHSEFNYSENPSFTKGTNGELIHDISINNPQVYPTTIGLYNDSNELIAVSKLSRPLLKDFTKEANFRIKIDF